MSELRAPSRLRIGIVVPCYNEEASVPDAAVRLTSALSDLVGAGLATSDSGVYFVDDGSTDGTWRTIERLAADDNQCNGIKLTRNFGHQCALLAGLLSVPGDVLISIDADLQDDVSAIREMVEAHAAGAEIVYGVRRQRTSDSWFKRTSAEGYYRLAALLGVRLVFNHADYRLLSRRAVRTLGDYHERNVFLRGLVPELGFSSAIVYYDRRERMAGASKYPVKKMLGFAIDGITSFSAGPLKMITWLGLLVALTSFTAAIWAAWVWLFNPAALPGWASTVIPAYLLGGIQLLSLGIIGQYVAKIHIETKQRPRFIIEKTL